MTGSGSDEINVTDDKARFFEGCVSRVTKATLQGAAGGFLIGGATLSWYPDPFRVDARGRNLPKMYSFLGMLRGLRSPVLWSTLVCTTFSAVECGMESFVNDKEKSYVSAGAAGAAAGLVIGSMSRRIDIMAGCAMYIGMMFGMIEYNGQKLSSGDEHSSDLFWEKFVSPRIPNPEVLKGLKEKYPEYKNL